MSACEIYGNGREIILISQVETEWGWRLSAEPVKRLACDVSPEEIGGAVIACLFAFRTGVPHPADVDDAGRAVLEAAGAGSWEELADNYRKLYAEVAKEGLVVMPQERTQDGGFVPIDAAQEAIPLDVSEIGQAVIRLLSNRI